MKGFITNVKHLAVHDGNGIRTTVFFKGCSLSCKWCHNPENITVANTLSFYENECILCGECVKACPKNVHKITPQHTIAREDCIYCGTCERACPMECLKIYGKSVTAEELLLELKEDEAFYTHSGGGITFSGGEPLLQADFIAEACKKLPAYSVNIDTCGQVEFECFEKVLPYTDCFLYDIKHMDEEKHKEGTGASNRLILENLQRLDALGAETEIRIPLIAGFNDDEENLRKTADFIKTLKHCSGIKILPYHDLAQSKYEAMAIPFIRYQTGNKGLAEKMLGLCCRIKQ